MKHICPPRCLRFMPAAWLLTACFLVPAAAQDPAVVERISDDVRFFTSEALEGRGVETEGIHKAAEYIREEFEQLGLASGVEDGSYLQPFEVTLSQRIVPENTSLTVIGPESEMTLELGEQFQPLRIGGEGTASADLVFAGYGISSEEYDDYAELDVEGKIVVIIRREPQQDQEDSVFNGTDASPHSSIRTKVQVAKDHGAAGVILVNDPHTAGSADEDELASPDMFGGGSNLPFAHVRQSVIAELLELHPVKTEDGTELNSLGAIEDYIDENMTPISQPLEGWKAELVADFEEVKVTTSNVIGVLEGEGPHADQTIVIGGHYDHLGFGGYGSRARGRNEIHNGADDNASGTAAVMELARRFATADQPPSRRLVFIAFSGEERGLLGASHYTREPCFPLEDTIAMVNFDMIGRLRPDGVIIYGVKTSPQFAGIVEGVTESSEFKVTGRDDPFAGSDHLPFYNNDIPVVFFHTGLTDTYHTPEDDFETLNMEGMAQVIDASEVFVSGLLDLEGRPEFVRVARQSPRRGGSMAYFGARPDYGADVEGLLLGGVNDESPAAEAGLKAGDIIIKMAGQEISDIEGMAAVLRENRPGTTIEVTVKRGEEEVTVEVTLARSPRGASRQ